MADFSPVINLYCIECSQDVYATLTTGKEIYPHRRDLHELPFWVHRKCGNYIGCHHKRPSHVEPLGPVIPDKLVRKMRIQIHNAIDPLWKQNLLSRGQVYKKMSHSLGYDFHSSHIRSLEEAQLVFKHAVKLRRSIVIEQGEELEVRDDY